MTDKPFGEFARLYRERGFWPRPIAPGSKACPIKGWQRPDSDFPPESMELWASKHGSSGLGLLMGSPFPDGTLLAALDIDRDEYVPLARALLRDPPSGRIGAKGAAFFCRVRGDGRYRQFKTKEGPIGELLCERRLCVLPPTIHPKTGLPYRWIGVPIQEVSFEQLPLVEA